MAGFSFCFVGEWRSEFFVPFSSSCSGSGILLYRVDAGISSNVTRHAASTSWFLLLLLSCERLKIAPENSTFVYLRRIGEHRNPRWIIQLHLSLFDDKDRQIFKSIVEWNGSILLLVTRSMSLVSGSNISGGRMKTNGRPVKFGLQVVGCSLTSPRPSAANYHNRRS